MHLILSHYFDQVKKFKGYNKIYLIIFLDNFIECKKLKLVNFIFKLLHFGEYIYQIKLNNVK